MEPCLFRHGKEVLHVDWPILRAQLQWSHVFSDMVRLYKRRRSGRNITGLQWSHVFSDMVSQCMTSSGVDPWGLQWSHVFSDMVRSGREATERRDDAASMEPCLFRHGKPTRGPPCMRGTGLQWSHVFSDMVSICYCHIVLW